MAKLVWDDIGQKEYEAGVDHGVLYPVSAEGTYPQGVVWNGLITVSESPEGGDENAFYADNIKYGVLRGNEDFGGSIEAYMSPKEFDACDGSATLTTGVIATGQTRKGFGLCYRTLIGNDVQGLDYGYKLHLVYGASCSPSEKSRETINESPDASSLSWDFTTTPVPISATGFKPTSHLVVDSTLFKTEAEKAKLAALERALYGCEADATAGIEAQDAHLPLPDDVIDIITNG